MCYPDPLVLCSSLVLFVFLSLSLPAELSISVPFLLPFCFLSLSLPFSCFSFCQSHPRSLAFCFSFSCNAVLLLFLCSISVSQSVYDYYCHSLCVFLSASVAYWFSVSFSMTSSRNPFFFILLPHWSWARDSQETSRWVPLPTRASGWHKS